MCLACAEWLKRWGKMVMAERLLDDDHLFVNKQRYLTNY